jgi:carbamoyl-phosphate synthase small subunit
MMIPSQLILESGEIFSGLSPEWQQGAFFGEVVFSTGMTGYVESLTDPSYAGQILTFTYPLIGNYGVPSRNTWESGKVQAAGVITGSVSSVASHWDSEDSFLDWLKKYKTPLITGVDTRAITKLLRQKGTTLGAICQKRPTSFPKPSNLVKQVSCTKKETIGRGSKTIIAVDCGMKENILRSLAKLPVKIVRVPYDYDYSNDSYDALFISNGPGDPAACTKTIEILRKNLHKNKPVMGICLGVQLLALAIGAKTYKLPFGHRGQNHPCLDLETNKAILTSQNHGFAIEEKTLPSDWKVLFRSLNDGSIEGISHKTKPFFAVQFHPESHPGPQEAYYLFNRFYEAL